jgi:hypothetical protein
MSSNPFRLFVMSVASAAVAFMVITGGLRPAAPATDVGQAGVALGDDTARVVEQVAYRQDVVRIGDVVVVDGQPSAPIDDPDIAATWAIVDAIWPDSLRSELRQLSVIEEESRGLVGVVHPAVDGGWILSLDLADLGDRVLIEETIVHELSHVVTLAPDVFGFGEGVCVGVKIELGCAAPDSVLADYATTFWPGDDGSGDEADYVNDYAMTAAHEDLSETFTAMVLGWPVEGGQVDAKLAMLEGSPQLAALAMELGGTLG